MTNIIHITSPEKALNILHTGAYSTANNPGSYDAGMNFLGVLGEYKNTQPTRGAEIHCEWHGSISKPLPYDSSDYHTPDTLFDFNGSGNHFPNNDPRYFLPYGSNGLVVKKIALETKFDEENLVKWWVELKGGFYPYIHKFKFFKTHLLEQALKYLQEVNEKLASEQVAISIQRGR